MMPLPEFSLRIHADPATTSPAVSETRARFMATLREAGMRPTGDGYITVDAYLLLIGKDIGDKEKMPGWKKTLRNQRWEGRGPVFRRLNGQVVYYSLESVIAEISQNSENNFI